MASETVYIALGLGAAFYIAWNLGANDAANPTESAVGCGAVKLRDAVLLFAVFAAIGALLQGYMVMKTIGKGVVTDIDPRGALVASIAAGMWITIATWKGMPVSTTHSTVGAVLGIGLAYSLLEETHSQINWNVVLMVVLSWITSPLSAIILSIALYSLFNKLKKTLDKKTKNTNKIFKYILLFNLAFSAYAFGVNDVANATGVYVSVVSKIYGVPDKTTMLYLAALGSIGIALGALTWGYRVIRTVGYGITRLDYVMAAAAELSNALVVWLFSTIPKILIGYGMPISTTHASVSSIIGVGIARSKSLRNLNLRTIALIVASWILTVPAAALLSIIIYYILYTL